jgi:serine/threonine protein kinase
LLEIAEGLKYLHSKNIIHGDLKGVYPEYLFPFSQTNAPVCQNNVFIDENWNARLADFGLACWADATLSTSTSNHVSSVRWMAPELFHPSDAFCRTTLSDVYAFACVAIEVATLFITNRS